MKTQVLDLIDYLKRGKSITSKEAMEKLGIASLHRRLSDIRERGYIIADHWKEVQTRRGRTRVKVYRLAKGKK